MTSSVHLTPFAWSIAEALTLWADLDTVRFTNWPLTQTVDAAAVRLAAMQDRYGSEPRHFGPFAIRRADGSFVGLIGAELRAEAEDEYEVWYVLRRDAWGQGLGHQALGELLRRLRASGRVRRAVATAVTTNAASWKLLERHGFVRDHVIPGGHQKHGGPYDVYAYILELQPD